jgi:hypothetical protein
MHVVFYCGVNSVEFVTSDGRTGSEPNLGYGLLDGHETVVRLMHMLGMTPDCTYEIIHA